MLVSAAVPYLRFAALILTLTVVAGCTPLDAGPVSESSTTETATGPTGSGTTEPTGTTGPTSSSSGTTDESTTAADETGSSSTTESPTSDSDSEEWSSTANECDFTCGTNIECAHPEVSGSESADPCPEGFYCEDASACGCEVTYCHKNCEPGTCSQGKVCDPESGKCVDP